MAEIGLRSGRIRDGVYKQGIYAIERVMCGWDVFIGTGYTGQNFKTLGDAREWCRCQVRKAA